MRNWARHFFMCNQFRLILLGHSTTVPFFTVAGQFLKVVTLCFSIDLCDIEIEYEFYELIDLWKSFIMCPLIIEFRFVYLRNVPLCYNRVYNFSSDKNF